MNSGLGVILGLVLVAALVIVGNIFGMIYFLGGLAVLVVITFVIVVIGKFRKHTV